MSKDVKRLVIRWFPLLSVIAMLFLLTGCDEADKASRNISKAADNFEINRRVVFINGITGGYLLEIVGRCSIFEDRRVSKGGRGSAQLEVTCKLGERQFKKHFLGLSDNTTYVAEQLDAADVNAYHYRITFAPQTLLPDFDFRGDASEAFRNAGEQ